MKKTLAAALLLASGLSHAGFVGHFAPANWAIQFSNGFCDGTAAFGASSLTMVSETCGGNFHNGANTDVTIALLTSGTVSFRWDYITRDMPASNDPFFAFGPSLVQLSDNAGPNAQGGNYTFSANAGDSIGFRVRSRDDFGGASTVTITNFQFDDGTASPIPEPGSLALVGFAFAAAAWAGRRARRASAPCSVA
jgi:hypothetical protein